MESVKQYTKSRQILQRNVFRHCTDFTFPVSLLFLLPGPGGEELAIMMAPSPAPRLMGREVWPPVFVTCLGFWDLTWLGVWQQTRRAEEGREGRDGGVWEGRGAKTNKHKEKYNMLVNKRIRRTGMERLLSVPGSVNFEMQHFAWYILYRRMYRLQL